MIWFSRQQKRVQSSSFGSKVVALIIGTKLLVSLRYKMRMFGVPIDGYEDIFFNNQYMKKNIILLQSVLNKRHNSICYHILQDAQDTEIISELVGSNVSIANLI